jgi:hypothetical protein
MISNPNHAHTFGKPDRLDEPYDLYKLDELYELDKPNISLF